MKLFKKTMILAGCIAALGLGAATAVAQGGGGGGGGFGGGGGGGGFGGGGAGGFGGGGGGRGGRGGFGAANLDQIRSDMEVKDDAEWNAISAKITAVQTARMATVGGRGGRGRRGGAAAGGGAAPATTPLADAIAELQKAYDDNAPAADIKAKLAKVRDERKAAQDGYVKAQDELRALLTTRQEAYLALNGLLN